MPSIKSKARQLRFDLQALRGEAVSIQEVADAVGIDRVRLNNIELGKIKQIATDELEGLCSYYSKMLGRTVDTNEILGYDPTNKRAAMQGLVEPVPA